MIPNDNFKNALKAGDLADALVIALTKATELKITTSVVSANDYFGKNPHLHPEDCLETKVNLLKGEIENKIGENLLKSELYENLQKLHLEEAIESNKLIQNNLENLQKLFTIIAKLKQQQLKIKNTEILSLHLGNKLSSPPPSPKISYTPPLQEFSTNPSSAVMVTEIESLTPKKTDSKKSNQPKQYDWKTLTESMIEPEQIQDENQTIDEIEDWGDLILEDEPRIEKSVVKQKNINTDTTVAYNQEINNLISDENLDLVIEDNPEKQSDGEDDLIEHLSIENDSLNLDTKVISETEIQAFLAEENKRIISEKNPNNSAKKSRVNNSFISQHYLPNSKDKSISENEINEMLINDNWDDLLQDSEDLHSKKSEDIDYTENVSLLDSDDDWDDVIEELYEPKIPYQNKGNK
jgi:hypothetical protein